MNTTTTTALDEPAIWLGCLSCYNNGRLNGKWITAEQAAEPEAAETLNGLATLETTTGLTDLDIAGNYTVSRCIKCFGDEFDVMDYQLIPQSCADAKEFYDNAEQLAELHNTGELETITLLASNLAMSSLDELIEYHHNNYQGEYNTMNDFAEHLINEGVIEIPATMPAHWVDIDAIARDLQHDHFEIAGHIWRNS
jgi:antirestriction protein